MISLICATSQNKVIGIDNQLPWRLSADLKRFKSLTLGHHILMGRKTFESIGRPLPGRTSVIITRQADYQADGCRVAHSLEEALALSRNDDEIFIIGGAAIYEAALKYADRIYLTIIQQDFEGDTYLFEIDPLLWQEVSREEFEPDERNPFRYSFLILERRESRVPPTSMRSCTLRNEAIKPECHNS
jgi:dihydrofolate reductase